MLNTILLVLILIAAVAVPVLLHFHLRKLQRAETERLLSQIDQTLGASVKLLEVRSYYDQMSAEYRKMLDEAYKEGNRMRQDHIRRLLERLEQLKARTLDRTVRILESQQVPPIKKRRRRGGRRFHRHGEGQATPPGSQGPSQPPTPPSPAS